MRTRLGGRARLIQLKVDHTAAPTAVFYSCDGDTEQWNIQQPQRELSQPRADKLPISPTTVHCKWGLENWKHWPWHNTKCKCIFWSLDRWQWKRDVIFPNYSKKKPAEDTLVPPLWGTREENVCFQRNICSRCCTRRNLRFHVENSQQADQKQLTRR